MYAKWISGGMTITTRNRSDWGAKRWSEEGRWCGDHASFDGCGSWWHAHHEGGLCEECWRREVGGEDIEPRDVRVSRELAA